VPEYFERHVRQHAVGAFAAHHDLTEVAAGGLARIAVGFDGSDRVAYSCASTMSEMQP
jgi:hypothetical protein